MTRRAEFRELESAWLAALRQRDRARLGRLLADDFLSTPWSSDGDVIGKRAYLEALDDATLGPCAVHDLAVQDLGPVVVVKFRLDCEWSAGGRSCSTAFLVTDVWRESGGEWRAVSRHASLPYGAPVPALTP